MRILLDSHLVVWALLDRSKLKLAARRLIEDAEAVSVSAASVWEIGIKVALGQLELDMDELLEELNHAGFERLAVTWEHGRSVRDLPLHHRDPFDRMLIAQALTEPLQLVTHDRTLARYGAVVRVV